MQRVLIMHRYLLRTGVLVGLASGRAPRRVLLPVFVLGQDLQEVRILVRAEAPLADGVGAELFYAQVPVV